MYGRAVPFSFLFFFADSLKAPERRGAKLGEKSCKRDIRGSSGGGSEKSFFGLQTRFQREQTVFYFWDHLCFELAWWVFVLSAPSPRPTPPKEGRGKVNPHTHVHFPSLSLSLSPSTSDRSVCWHITSRAFLVFFEVVLIFFPSGSERGFLPSLLYYCISDFPPFIDIGDAVSSCYCAIFVQKNLSLSFKMSNPRLL